MSNLASTTTTMVGASSDSAAVDSGGVYQVSGFDILTLFAFFYVLRTVVRAVRNRLEPSPIAAKPKAQ